MNYGEVKAAWNAKADEHNDWTVLGADEMVEFAMSIEREECAKICDKIAEQKISGNWSSADSNYAAGAEDCASLIRYKA